MRCPRCGTEVPSARLDCPLCGGLVHAEELARLAARAAESRAAADAAAEREAWRQALVLLPAGSGQAATVGARVEELSLQVARRAPAGTAPPTQGSAGAWKSGGLVALGLLAWKLKGVLLLVLSKGKLLLLGLTKMGTLSSMILSLGVYWATFGWKFALGLVGSIYVHEMGHVAALRRFGIPASAPMFIPGFGAMIRLRQSPAGPREDARVGLAGPIWGLGAALAAYLVHLASGWPSWAAVARTGAWLNLFNLLPVWQLDGGRGFRALSRPQVLLATAGIGAAWLLTREALLLLLLAVAGFRALSAQAEGEGDRAVLAQYLGLVAVLAALCLLEVPGIPPG